MARKVHQDKREAKDWMVIKARMDPRDSREKWATAAPQVPLRTRLIPPWPKVSGVTQDSQGPTGSQEAGVNQETRAHQAPLARPSETKMAREVYQVKWGPKAS